MSDAVGGHARTLTPLLLGLTVLSGVVDAVSYLGLSHVFVANMTGNIVFLGFAVAGSHDVSVSGSLTALGAFVVGALIGGRLASRLAVHKGRHLAWSTWLSAAFVVGALVIAATAAQPTSFPARHFLTALLGLAMGVQNATARRLAVADLVTSVLTLTITGLAADSRLVGGTSPRLVRRLGSVLSMLLGALLGGLLVVHVSLQAGIGLALFLLLLTATSVSVLARGTDASAWQA